MVGSRAHERVVSHVFGINGLITLLKAACLPPTAVLLGVFYCLLSNFSSLTSTIDIIIITKLVAS